MGEVKLHPVAVELDLVQPAITARHLLDGGCQRRFDEAWEVGLDGNGGWFLTLKRHNPSVIHINGSNALARSHTGYDEYAKLRFHCHRSRI